MYQYTPRFWRLPGQEQRCRYPDGSWLFLGTAYVRSCIFFCFHFENSAGVLLLEIGRPVPRTGELGGATQCFAQRQRWLAWSALQPYPGAQSPWNRLRTLHRNGKRSIVDPCDDFPNQGGHGHIFCFKIGFSECVNKRHDCIDTYTPDHEKIEKYEKQKEVLVYASHSLKFIRKKWNYNEPTSRQKLRDSNIAEQDKDLWRLHIDHSKLLRTVKYLML